MLQPQVVEAVGMVAACLTTIAFLPQVIKLWRTRSTGDVSLTTMTVLAIGICLWLAYGAMLGNRPLLLANGITLLLVLGIVVAKLRWP